MLERAASPLSRQGSTSPARRPATAPPAPHCVRPCTLQPPTLRQLALPPCCRTRAAPPARAAIKPLPFEFALPISTCREATQEKFVRSSQVKSCVRTRCEIARTPLCAPPGISGPQGSSFSPHASWSDETGTRKSTTMVGREESMLSRGECMYFSLLARPDPFSLFGSYCF